MFGESTRRKFIMKEKIIKKLIETLSPPLQIIFLSASVAIPQLSFRLAENADTFFVMNLGRYVIENGFPHIDPFTIHENLKLVAQQWLSGIFFEEVYKFMGADGLRMADCLIGTILVVIHWRLCLFVLAGKRRKQNFIVRVEFCRRRYGFKLDCAAPAHNFGGNSFERSFLAGKIHAHGKFQIPVAVAAVVGVADKFSCGNVAYGVGRVLAVPVREKFAPRKIFTGGNGDDIYLRIYKSLRA